MKKVQKALHERHARKGATWTNVVAVSALSLSSLGSVANAQKAPPVPSAAEGSTPAQEAAQTDAAQTELLERALSPDPTGLTADEVVEKALKHSPILHKARTQTSKADANAARALLAFVPRIDLSGRAMHLGKIERPDLVINGMPAKNPFPQVLNQYSTTASATLPITDLFLTILPTYQGAKLASSVAQAEEDARRLSAAFDARMAFYMYVRARGAAIVREDSVRVLAAHVEDLTALSGAGAATETDRIRAEARLAQAKLALAQTQGGVEVSLVRLSRAMGEQVDISRPIGERLFDNTNGGVSQAGDALQEAFEKRPELRALRALVSVREKQESARRGAEAPKLSAFANGYYANPNQRFVPLSKDWNPSWDVGVQLTWSPNDYVQARLQTSDAELDTDMVQDDMRLLEDSIAVEVASALVDSRLAIERINASEQNAKATARRYADQRALMMAGAATPSDVLEAEQEMRQAQLEWVDAYVQAKMARATLFKARGYVTTSDAPVGQGNAP